MIVQWPLSHRRKFEYFYHVRVVGIFYPEKIFGCAVHSFQKDMHITYIVTNLISKWAKLGQGGECPPAPLNETLYKLVKYTFNMLKTKKPEEACIWNNPFYCRQDTTKGDWSERSHSSITCLSATTKWYPMYYIPEMFCHPPFLLVLRQFLNKYCFPSFKGTFTAKKRNSWLTTTWNFK